MTPATGTDDRRPIVVAVATAARPTGSTGTDDRPPLTVPILAVDGR